MQRVVSWKKGGVYFRAVPACGVCQAASVDERLSVGPVAYPPRLCCCAAQELVRCSRRLLLCGRLHQPSASSLGVPAVPAALRLPRKHHLRQPANCGGEGGNGLRGSGGWSTLAAACALLCKGPQRPHVAGAMATHVPSTPPAHIPTTPTLTTPPPPCPPTLS